MTIRNMLSEILNEAAGSRSADNQAGDKASEKIEKDVTKEAGWGKGTGRKADKSGTQADHEGTKISDPSGAITQGKGTEVQGNTDTHKGLGEEQVQAVSRTVAESIAEMSNFTVDMTAMKSLLEAQELGEEFSSKAVEIFEAAVNDLVKQHVMQIAEEADAIIAESVALEVTALEEQVDRYLSYVVTEWSEENRVAIEQGARTELAESFMDELKGLLESHYVELPTDKVDLYEVSIAKGEELYAKLQEAEELNVQLAESVIAMEKAALVESVVTGLTAVQAEKVRSLAESISFSDVGEFTSKLTMLSESYVGTKASTAKNTLTEDVGTIIENIDVKSYAPAMDPAVAAASAAISRFNQ